MHRLGRFLRPRFVSFCFRVNDAVELYQKTGGLEGSLLHYSNYFQSRDSTWASILVPVSCGRRKQGQWLLDGDISLVPPAALLLGPGFDCILED